MVFDTAQLQVILFGLTLMESTEAMALMGQQNLLYLYDSNRVQLAKINGTLSKMLQTDVSWAGVQVSTGCYLLYNQEDFEGPGVKVESGSVKLKDAITWDTNEEVTWSTVKSIKYLSSAEECNNPDKEGGGSSLFSIIGTIVGTIVAVILLVLVLAWWRRKFLTGPGSTPAPVGQCPTFNQSTRLSKSLRTQQTGPSSAPATPPY